MANCITVVSVSASFTTQVKMSCLKQLNGGDIVCLKIVFTPVFINTPITEFPLLCYKAMVSTHRDVLWTVLFFSSCLQILIVRPAAFFDVKGKCENVRSNFRKEIFSKVYFHQTISHL